jgi:parallel beta-helix repeat protein
MLRNTVFNEKSQICLKRWACKSARKRFSMLSFVAIMVIGTFALASNLFFSTARATYIGGTITQNTVWTLVDSPFVVSQNVTVNSGATLTIEPGVQVKFGGPFSFIINGQLIANGTQDSMITFTSNSYQPSPGDWGTIEISGSQQSLLAYCSIKYATNGTTTKNGNLEVKNSVVSNSAQCGISIINSNVQILANQIANNSASGIYASGNDQVTIQDNTISSNGDGILLDGNNSTGVSGVNISNNIVLSNTQSGIHLNSGMYTNLVVLYNNVSANGDGFLISGQGVTQITNNSASYNSIGFFYSAGQNHQAHWNNIYENTMGMDISSSTTGMVVNATYNYWGDPSGPHHASLNPAGKGNPVGGNGLNLVFIFFLLHPFSYVDQPPTASLWADKTLVPPNQPVTFIGTLSSASGQVDQYFFDFGDGQNSGWTTLSVLVHSYSTNGSFQATLKVKDDFGVASNNVATVSIKCETGITPLTVSLIPQSLTITSGKQLSITALVTNTISPVANASVTLYPTGGSCTSSSGLTNSSGDFTATFSAPVVTQIANVRMTASASKAGYGDGSDYKYLTIVPPLVVQLTANPSEILSEATANVTALVTYSGTPVPNATVSIASNYGSFTQGTGITGSSGSCTFVFTAPKTGTQLMNNITATATKTGYVGGQDQLSLTIEPKVLFVQVVAASSVNSEMSTNVTVNVLYDSNPISGATVVMSSNMSGSFAPANSTTNTIGQCAFIFTAPQVTTSSSVKITAAATVTGYANSSGSTTLLVKLGTLIVQLASRPAQVQSGKISTITVLVTYNSKPVANTNVTLSSAVKGTLSPTTSSTDQNGNCEFIFTAPQTTTQYTIDIAANATKTGYISGQGQIGMTVNPVGSSGLPLIIILAVIAAIVIVVVVVILIKLKIIVISQKGE